MLSKPTVRKPSPALVISLLALFVALSSSSIAAPVRDAAAKLITGKNVKNSSLTGKDVKDRSLSGRDIKKSSVTTTEVKDRSLLSRDFKPGQLPAGAQGLKGDTGAKGDLGPTEGASNDQPPQSLAEESSMDSGSFTTAHAGRLLVSKTIDDVSVNCTAGEWVTWLDVDGARVPGTMVVSGASGTHLHALTLTGVTGTAVPAGSHTLRFGIDCVGGNFASSSSLSNEDLTYVVLGNG